MDAQLVNAAAIVALLMFAGHWFKWPGTLHRLAAYAYGCIGILIGVALWKPAILPPVFVLFAAAGLATVLAYGYDASLTRISDWLAERKAARARGKS